MRPVVVASVLAADFACLGDQVQEAVAGGAGRIQVDVMDGHFVPNLTMGPMVVEAIRRVTDVPLEVHLMVERPDQYVEAFVKAGADILQVQVESTPTLYRTVDLIRQMGKQPGVAINPATPVEALREILPYVSQVNVMTVEPGFGGQAFIGRSPDKVARVRAMSADVEIEVDGGIDSRTAPLVYAAGATCLVAGSAVFKHPGGIAAGVKAILEVVG